MRDKRSYISSKVSSAIFTIALLATSAWAAPRETILHDFKQDGRDGVEPRDSLIFDASGNLYGTTFEGGTHGAGMVFELIPQTGGGWKEKVLHNFNNDGKDGVGPYASLIFDTAGNLYGTTFGGGAIGYGTVFELKPKAGGTWTQKVLHSFNAQTEGFYPTAGLVLDSAGNLYGTTSGNDLTTNGMVFELSPRAGRGWKEKVLYRFKSETVYAGLVLDSAGNLYGTTPKGPGHTGGRVFELVPQKGGRWKEKVLHQFTKNGMDGYFPEATLILDTTGNLYGTTSFGGAHDAGTVFELTPRAEGRWTEALLYSFRKNGIDGAFPDGSLIFDAAGNLFGTTGGGGPDNAGAVFELTPAAGGGWNEKVLHKFRKDGRDGNFPEAGLVLDAEGNLYGTTFEGGTGTCGGGCGTAFEVTP